MSASFLLAHALSFTPTVLLCFAHQKLFKLVFPHISKKGDFVEHFARNLFLIILVVALVGLFSSGVLDAYTGAYVRREATRESARLFSTVESGPQNCFDGIDNDRDALIDCADPGCVATRSDTALGWATIPAVCGVEQGESCGDAWDNDGDLLVDCSDTDCREASGCR